MFAAATGVILVGGAAERSRLGPLLVFVFIWSTLVYNPIACATWAPNGWAFQLGALDFAGGGPFFDFPLSTSRLILSRRTGSYQLWNG